MSIPLIQKAEKDDINTSIIAIKRNIERINMLLGLVDNESPDLSGFATKQELQDAVTALSPVDEVTIGNMHSVTSNAVARAISYSAIEIFTGEYDCDGRKIYKVTLRGFISAGIDTSLGIINNIRDIYLLNGIIRQNPSITANSYVSIPYFVTSTDYCIAYILKINGNVLVRASTDGDIILNLKYTKTTD